MLNVPFPMAWHAVLWKGTFNTGARGTCTRPFKRAAQASEKAAGGQPQLGAGECGMAPFEPVRAMSHARAGQLEASNSESILMKAEAILCSDYVLSNAKHGNLTPGNGGSACQAIHRLCSSCLAAYLVLGNSTLSTSMSPTQALKQCCQSS